MTFKRQITRWIAICDICGTEGEYVDGWGRYSSIQMDEYSPHLAPTACPNCKDELQRRVNAGEVVVPKLSSGYQSQLQGKPVGYAPAYK